ncbi:hypothetical protein C8R46DRAFT_1087572 [Mycena filopes]|nr:hypothetical protein C8R46DRAFT_1087572 [Mycena filopes]
MPHTPSVPSPIRCPESSCGRIFTHPHGLKVHRNVHAAAQDPQDLQLKCPIPNCSFKAPQFKDLEAHVDTAHHDQRRQLQCLEPNCGFSTTSQGALTRHYRERHGMEPPVSLRKVAPPPRRRLKLKRNGEQASSAPSFASSSAMVLDRNKYYPAAYYTSSSSGASTSVASSPMRTELAATSRSLQAVSGGPPQSPRPRQAPMPSEVPSTGTEQWMSWRDDDVYLAPDALALASGELEWCEDTMGSRTEFLPVHVDVGMVDKRSLWASPFDV